jgi:arylsulfatase A-like enzyme
MWQRARTVLLLACVAAALQVTAANAQRRQHNLILFIPDGLRALAVTPETAPAMAAVRDKGVNFANPHSLFPTFTMPNSSGMSTGHYLGDTGVFSNTIFSGFPVHGGVTPFIENDAILGDIDEHFAANFVNEETILKAARARGFSTAAIGKLGPTLMFDHTERTGALTIIIDDSTGTKNGIPLSKEVQDALAAAGLPIAAPSRGENGPAGNFEKPGTKVANVVQQAFFAEAAAKVVLPMFNARNKPFVLVFWSRDPDGTQHNQGDSLNTLTPGINGPTSMAAIKNADDNLARLRQALEELGLADTTDIVIAADHGFSTISKQSETSEAAKGEYKDVVKGLLPPGFVAIDLAKALQLPLADPDDGNKPVEPNSHSKRGNGLIGKDPAKPDVVVAANGGSDLIYLPQHNRVLARAVIDALLKQDYVSGIFVDQRLGRFAGTLPLSSIALQGSAITPMPAIVINFRSFSTGCEQPLMCAVSVADTGLQQGQGMHGSFSRADTMNFMAAIGPSFKQGFVNQLPVSNADVGMTIVHLLGLKIAHKGHLVGRVIEEAFPNGRSRPVAAQTIRSEASAGGLATILKIQKVAGTSYFDAAGFRGRTVGLEEQKAATR